MPAAKAKAKAMKGRTKKTNRNFEFEASKAACCFTFDSFVPALAATAIDEHRRLDDAVPMRD